MRIYGDGDKELRPKMSESKNGQMVRIITGKAAFDNIYIQNWREEHCLVPSDKCAPRRVFKLIDKGCEEHNGSWYAEEVKEITKNRILIDNVIRKRSTDKAEQEDLVKWKVRQVMFNPWIPACDIDRVK